MEPGQLVGQSLFAFLLMLGCGWLAVRAANAERRSQRLGNAAAACGVGGFAAAALGVAAEGGGGPNPFLIAAGAVILLLAVAGIVVGVWSLRARRSDRGAALGAAVGIVFGAINLFCGASVTVMGSGVMTSAGSNPWTFKSAEHDVEITLPSDRWAERADPKVVASFLCTRPVMMALMKEVRPAPDRADFDRAVEFARGLLPPAGLTDPVERSGTNPFGNPYWFLVGSESAADHREVVGISVTWLGGSRVAITIFEGQHRMASRVGTEQEAATFRAAAEAIFTSVR